MTDAIAALAGVSLEFERGVGVFDLDLAMQPGTVVGLIGPSGSGKTTTVRLLLGLLRPQQGTVRVLGDDPARMGSRNRERIGYLPQQFILYPGLSVGENLGFAASLYGMGWLKRRGRMRDVLDFVKLGDVRGRLSGRLSGGMQRRLALACSLVHDPDLLFADEPTAGVDPVLRSMFWEHFRELRDAGKTLIVTTQYVGEAAYCDVVAVLRAGRLIHLAPPDALRRLATGGDVLQFSVAPADVARVEVLLQASPDVTNAHRVHGQPGLVRAYVAEAAAALPAAVSLLQEQHGIALRGAEPYWPSFDEIFVRLMEQADAADADQPSSVHPPPSDLLDRHPSNLANPQRVVSGAGDQPPSPVLVDPPAADAEQPPPALPRPPPDA